jgi:MFS family permease
VVPIGAILAGFIMEYIGRLNTIKIAAVPCIVGWFLVAAGSSFTAVLCGRLLTGVSAGNNTQFTCGLFSHGFSTRIYIMSNGMIMNRRGYGRKRPSSRRFRWPFSSLPQEIWCLRYSAFFIKMTAAS